MTTILFNKPFNVLSQFSDSSKPTDSDRQNLSHFLDLPGVRAAGRLDRDSEGLLVLTDDGALQHQLTNPQNKTSKTYWVQVEGEVSDTALHTLSQGVLLKDGMTLPARAEIMSEDPYLLWPRKPPIRFRKSIETSWLSLTLREGRNRQVRRMCAASGFPVLRLVRYRVGSWTLDGLSVGETRPV